MPLVTYEKKSGKGRKFNSWRIPYGKYDSKGTDLRGGRRKVQAIDSFLMVGGIANRVPEVVWNKIKEHPDVKDRLESGELVVLMKPQAQPEKPGDPLPAREPLSDLRDISSLKDYREAEATAIVENTQELSVLQPWLEAELLAEKPRTKLIGTLQKHIKKVADADRKLAEKK